MRSARSERLESALKSVICWSPNELDRQKKDRKKVLLETKPNGPPKRQHKQQQHDAKPKPSDQQIGPAAALDRGARARAHRRPSAAREGNQEEDCAEEVEKVAAAFGAREAKEENYRGARKFSTRAHFSSSIRGVFDSSFDS